LCRAADPVIIIIISVVVVVIIIIIIIIIISSSSSSSNLLAWLKKTLVIRKMIVALLFNPGLGLALRDYRQRRSFQWLKSLCARGPIDIFTAA